MTYKMPVLILSSIISSFFPIFSMVHPGLLPIEERLLYRAIESKNLAAVKEQMQFHNVNCKYADGKPLMHHVACSSSLAIAQYFLNSKVDLNHRDKNGATALMCAAIGGNHEIVEALLKAKADPNARDKDGCTPFMYASPFGFKDFRMMDLLMRHGADPRSKNNRGQSALYYLFMANRIAELEYLITKCKLKCDQADFTSRYPANLPCMPCEIDFMSHNALEFVLKKFGFLADNDLEFQQKKQFGNVLYQVIKRTRPYLLEPKIDSRYRCLFDPMQKDQRVVEWFDPAFLERQRREASYLRAKLYHQIPTPVLECLIRYGAKGNVKKANGKNDTSWCLQGIMEFNKPADNPWSHTREQRGIYHCTQGDDGKIYHVGFDEINEPRTLDEYH